MGPVFLLLLLAVMWTLMVELRGRFGMFSDPTFARFRTDVITRFGVLNYIQTANIFRLSSICAMVNR